MPTVLAIRNRVQEELNLGIAIDNGFFDAAAAGSITSARYLRDSNKGSNYWINKNTIIFRPTAASSADYIRFAGALTNSSGLLAHTGANYADTTVGTETVELWTDGVDPLVQFLDALNRAQTRVFDHRFVALSHLSNLDGDMALTTDTNWTDVGSPTTSAKFSTVGSPLIPWGLRSYRLVGDAVGEGTQSATLRISKNVPITAFTIIAAETGSVSFGGYDVTGSAVSSIAVTAHSEREPQLMKWYGSVSSTAEAVAMQALGTTNPADFYVNGMWVYKHDNLRLNLPSYVTEVYQTPEIWHGIPMYANAESSMCWNGESLDMVQLKEGRDYRLVANNNDANPNAIIVRDATKYRYPIFVTARVPHSTFGVLSAETDTTNAPLNQIVPATKVELLSSFLQPRNPAHWQPFWNKAYSEWQAANIVRVHKTASKPYFAGVNTV